MNNLKRYINWDMVIILLFFIIGSVGLSINYTHKFFLSLTPLLLLILNLFVLVKSLQDKKSFFLLFLLTIITILIEIVGVKTGLIFGEYSYGQNLGFKVAGVPIVIGLNWVLLILSSWTFVNQLKVQNKILRSLITAFIVTVLDFLIEPVAIKLDFWSWKSPEIPRQNYLVWFLISFIISLTFSFLYNKEKMNKDLLLAYLLGQFLFFCFLFEFR